MASHNQQQEQDPRCPHQHDDDGGKRKQLDEGVVVEEDQEQEVEDQEEEVGNAFHGVNIKKASLREEREFPPPIPLLAQTGNLQCHMPWVLRRSYENRHLVIRLVRVKHHEFFRAHRSGGRLRLQLVHFEDSPRRGHPTLLQDYQAHGTMDACQDSVDASGGGAGDEGEGDSFDRVVADHACIGEESGKNVTGGVCVCSITSSILHMHMPRIRPVHS